MGRSIRNANSAGDNRKLVWCDSSGRCRGAVLLRAEADAPAPVDPAPLIAKADQYQVTIHRDYFGIPHIYGKTDPDVAFGLAFAHAEDDFETIQEVAIASRGQLAAIAGIDAAVTDYLVHLLRVWDAVDAKYDTHVSAEARRWRRPMQTV